MLLEKERERFFAKVNKNGSNDCWEWNGYLFETGYGKVSIKRLHKNALKAHRVSYMMHCGPIPKGMKICHKCDNRKCVNPAHLFLGTQQDNVKDMIAKGRNANTKGSANGNSKLTESDIKEIVKLLSIKNNKEIGAIYKVTHSTISLIRLGKRWSEVTGISYGDRQIYESLKK